MTFFPFLSSSRKKLPSFRGVPTGKEPARLSGSGTVNRSKRKKEKEENPRTYPLSKGPSYDGNTRVSVHALSITDFTYLFSFLSLKA